MKIINKEIKRLETKFEFVDANYINPQFKKGRCKIAYAGNNRNYTGISKEAFIEALPSLALSPVVGYYDEGNGEFTDHTGKIEITANDVKYHTPTPIGVVPENFNYSFETVTESNGDVREYLCCDVILWTGRYKYITDAYVKGNGFRQSMEIEVDDYFCDSDGILQITKFTFGALCVLQSDVEPCFESSDIKLFALDKDKFKQEFSVLLQELKEDYKKEECDNLSDNKEKNTDITVENEIEVETIVEDEEVVIVEENTTTSEESKEEAVEENSETEEVKEEIINETDIKEEFKVKETQEYQELLEQFSKVTDKVLELETKITEFEDKVSILENEKTELLEFKSNIEKQNNLEEIEEISNKFSKKLNKDDIDILKEKAVSGEFNAKEFKYELALKLADREFEKEEINNVDESQIMSYSIRKINTNEINVKNESFGTLNHLFVSRDN